MTKLKTLVTIIMFVSSMAVITHANAMFHLPVDCERIDSCDK